jgi:UDP-2,3-diacylglucosamine pyrophosphatase LpxH
MATLIVSDIHLGSRNSQAEALSRLLETDFDRLILNGDTVNSLNLKKLKPKHWRLITRLRTIALERELILIRGNHDVPPGYDEIGFGPMDVLASLLGVRLHEEYQLEMSNGHYLVLHGDRFDPTLYWPMLTDAADWCYRAVQEVNKKAAKWLKRKVKRLGGVVEFVKRRSVQYAKLHGCQGIVTGHTHFCDDEWIDGVHYLNSGSWVDHPCTYVVAHSNQIRLCHWDEDLIERETIPSMPTLQATG